MKRDKKLSLLVCGGAGYIGSHMARMIAEAGHDVTVFDNLSTGHLEALKWGKFIKGDLRNQDDLDDAFQDTEFDAVFHFSGLIVVSESVEKPFEYYDNNVTGTINLLQAMRKYGVDKFIFSSTAAVYGDPVMDMITEDHPLKPLSPYGRSKLYVEEILQDYAEAYGFDSACFRYFNAAGAHPDSRIGEAHSPETHLIPNVLLSCIDEGRRLKIFGDSYSTPDGTCVRDYVHVQDLCSAHLKALNFINENKGAHVFNLGNGQGFSIIEVIKAASQVIGREIGFDFEPARSGDSPRLVADSSKAADLLGWEPEFDNLTSIIETAYRWHKKPAF
ncbi:UDP-glucose 4-epimerase GalE [Maridesulfovibrio hydrothermalis]|uniref:UDP-glucose 4-epimerase n=1 Tax=Maridesulfovibrio hydrothermalis AM13 = DSM 14728 TaxID=1121451 RepID=L0RCH6_9BACT|nr:UDP-glucose 4-epimerase GalE [Maridesulfovibrio hydrothermalis]CCO24483.1 UDP-glucose 4-epimerase [Maridesulfovibrio hydrothermalis AM13 = DSM 14728]